MWHTTRCSRQSPAGASASRAARRTRRIRFSRGSRPRPAAPPAAVGRLLAANFPHSRFLSPGRAAQLLAELADNGIAEGSVYDALVAAPAIEHALPLVSRDRRALSTYRDLGAEVEFLS